MNEVPSDDSTYDAAVWEKVAALGDLYILSVGCMYGAARGYISAWGSTRAPTTLLPGNLEMFAGRVQPELLSYVRDVAAYGVRPMATSPPVRSAQLPYSGVRDNTDRTANDMWEDLVKGRVMLFTKVCEHRVGPLMESRLAFATQKDVTKEAGVKVRYISDPRVEINERIEPKHHPRVRAPKHGNVARRILYWERRYPTIPALLCKRDVKGAFKLRPVSIVGLAHMGLQFANYMILYPSLYFGWKPSPASWGIISSLLLQFVASFSPKPTKGATRHGPRGIPRV